MENTKIFLENGIESNVSGIFYVYNSKYYFIYTTGEFDGPEYIKLYVVQVCKEIQNTSTGSIDTGCMIGMEISNSEEWAKVQESITKIVEDKKNNTQNSEIQYLPINMLTKLKIVNKNKFKLMKNIVEENFKVNIVELTTSVDVVQPVVPVVTPTPVDVVQSVVPVVTPTPVDVVQPVALEVTPIPVEPNVVPVESNNSIISLADLNATSSTDLTNKNDSDVIIDYRSRFFEEQEKNQLLQEEIKKLNEKIEQIKNVIG